VRATEILAVTGSDPGRDGDLDVPAHDVRSHRGGRQNVSASAQGCHMDTAAAVRAWRGRDDTSVWSRPALGPSLSKRHLREGHANGRVTPRHRHTRHHWTRHASQCRARRHRSVTEDIRAAVSVTWASSQRHGRLHCASQRHVGRRRSVMLDVMATVKRHVGVIAVVTDDARAAVVTGASSQRHGRLHCASQRHVGRRRSVWPELWRESNVT
jgi:hypothetical protein